MTLPMPTQTWPEEFARLYRQRGYWTGETFPAMLRRIAHEFGENTAIVGNGKRWTYAQLYDNARQVAAGFLELGLARGDRVLVQLPNVPEFFSTIFGLFLAGLVPVYALPAHRRTEIAHLAGKSGAKAYVIADRAEGFDYQNLAHQIIGDENEISHVIVIGRTARFIAYQALLSQKTTLPPDPDPSAVAFLQISGGSTGLSKLIARTHDDYLYSVRESANICKLSEKTRYLAALPVAHNFPMSSPGFLGVLHAGGTVVLTTSPAPHIAFPVIEQEKITMAALVPPLALLWIEAANSTKADLSTLELLQVGGAKFPQEAARKIAPALACNLQQVFGMAEGLVNYTRHDDPDETVMTTQGRPISPDDEILVLDDSNKPVPPGAVGHLLTRGPYTIRGYYNDDLANARAFTPDGFYRTGDMVRRLPSGHLEVLGRANDHINRAGEKISAEEIENHLLAHKAVFDAAVVSIPDPFLGERSCAFVIPVRNSAITPKDLKAFMRQRNIAEFKVPDEIVMVDAFEATAVGKTSRRDLREKLRAAHIKTSENA